MLLLIGCLASLLALIILFGAISWASAEDIRAHTKEFVEDSRFERDIRRASELNAQGKAMRVYDYVKGATGSEKRALKEQAIAQDLIDRGGKITLTAGGIWYWEDGQTTFHNFSDQE